MKKLLRKKRFLLLLLLLILGLLFYNSNWLGRLIYPIHYRNIIEENAANYGVDPFLVAAVIRVESNYNSDIHSRKGAVGLMQIMPDTASWIYDMDGFHSFSAADLHEPATNIKVGTRYLQILLKQFGSNQAITIAAYNAGPGVVSRWLQAETWDGSLKSAGRIPYQETRKYVNSVTYYYRKYVKLYGTAK